MVIPQNPIKQQPITSKPEPVVVPEPKEEVIRHNLFEEIEEVIPVKESLLMPTTEHIRNMEVLDAEEVVGFKEEVEEDDFVIINAQEIINEIEVNDEERISFEEKNEIKQEEEDETEQMTFTFDMPLSEEIKDIEVNEYDEVIPPVKVEEKFEEVKEPAPSIVRYQLEDEAEEVVVTKKVTLKEEEDVVFETKTIAPEIQRTVEEETTDPLDQPISEALRARASERRARMKDFNYKFRSAASNIDEIEKQPAYKRAGLNLERADTDSKVSRTSLSTDSNDDIQLRRNNSFLHDNVD